jgi:hypothetical protein
MAVGEGKCFQKPRSSFFLTVGALRGPAPVEGGGTQRSATQGEASPFIMPFGGFGELG